MSDASTTKLASRVLCVCRIAITTKGKYTALEAEAIEPLVELVNDEDSEVRTYALKVLTILYCCCYSCINV